MERIVRVSDSAKCTLCHPHKQFKDMYTCGKHMRKFHRLTAEVYPHGRGKGYNTGWWVK